MKLITSEMNQQKNILNRITLILLSLILYFGSNIYANDLLPVPALLHRITDEIYLLSEAQKEVITAELDTLELWTGAQASILIIESMDPESIEQFSMRVAESWNLGKSGIDNGILIIVARKDKLVRIDVGYGLEGNLPDAYCKRIIELTMNPYFEAEDYYNGILSGIFDFYNYLPLLEVNESVEYSEDPTTEELVYGFIGIGIILLLLSLITGTILTKVEVVRVFLKLENSIVVNSLYALLFYILFPIAVFVFAVVVYIYIKSGKKLKSTTSSSSSNSDNFSGGGGEFGGGGATGSWK